MKYLSFLLIIQSFIVCGQNNDSIDDCTIKYRQLNFLSPTFQVTPLTLFMRQNGNFFLQYGHLTHLEEGNIRYAFNKKGEQMTKCRVKYKNSYDSLAVNAINNFFPERYYDLTTSYFKSVIEEFSIILDGFNEQLLYDLSDSNVFRVISPCYNYIGDFNNQHYQSYNLIRVHLNSNILIFKTGHFDQNSNFIIDFEYTYFLNKKEIKQIQKKCNGIDFSDDNIYYRNNIERQRLFEFKKKENYHIYLRADSYENKFENISYFNGLFNRLHYIVRYNFYEPIGRCQ